MNTKVQAAGAAGAVTTVLVWVVGLLGLEVPPEVAAAVTTLIATGAGYMVRERSSWGAKAQEARGQIEPLNLLVYVIVIIILIVVLFAVIDRI